MAGSKNNFVGLLQEKCVALHIDLPEYSEESTEKATKELGKIFNFSCKLKDWVCHGTGGSKQAAKQNSAKEMLNKLEKENLSARENNDNFVGLLQEKCCALHIDLPEYSEESTEESTKKLGETFNFSCKLKGWVCHGTGGSKKAAKQNSAKEMLNKLEEEELEKEYLSVTENNDNFVGLLQEKCCALHIDLPEYSEESTEESTKKLGETFNFSCKLKGWVCHGTGGSKKAAKQNSAKEMLNKLEEENLEEENLSVRENNVNFVGLLQEKCVARYIDLPEYSEESTEEATKELGEIFNFTCKLKGWVCHGTGGSKKAAKQNSAMKMHNMLEEEELEKEYLSVTENNDNFVGLLQEKCNALQIDLPEYSDESTEEATKELGGIYNFSCKLKGWVCYGAGGSKKAAKQNSAKEMLNNLEEENLEEENLSVRENNDNFVGLLQEKCYAVHIALPEYSEESTEEATKEMGGMFKFSCTLKGWVCHGTGGSKKTAKQNSAKEMLRKIAEENLSLEGNTHATPPPEEEENYSPYRRLLKFYETCNKQRGFGDSSSS